MAKAAKGRAGKAEKGKRAKKGKLVLRLHPWACRVGLLAVKVNASPALLRGRYLNQKLTSRARSQRAQERSLGLYVLCQRAA